MIHVRANKAGEVFVPLPTALLAIGLGLLLVLSLGVIRAADDAYQPAGTQGVPINQSADLGLTVTSRGNAPLTVTAVAPESPASVAGLLSGDQLLSINGKLVSTAADLTAGLKAAAAGDGDVELLIRRGEASYTFFVKLRAERDETPRSVGRFS